MAQTTFAPRSAVVCRCRFASAAPAHHDQLVHAATDVAMAVELVELAVTWNELDYRHEKLIPPSDWLAFVAEHTWDDAEAALRLFSVAVDVANRPAVPLTRGCSN